MATMRITRLNLVLAVSIALGGLVMALSGSPGDASCRVSTAVLA